LLPYGLGCLGVFEVICFTSLEVESNDSYWGEDRFGLTNINSARVCLETKQIRYSFR
jgi:hypothetical protein